MFTDTEIDRSLADSLCAICLIKLLDASNILVHLLNAGISLFPQVVTLTIQSNIQNPITCGQLL